MQSTLKGRIGRLGISVVVALAIMGGVGAGVPPAPASRTRP